MKELLRHIPFLRFWNGTFESRLDSIERQLQEAEQRLDARLLKLERIERLTERVTKDRVHRTRNFSEFRKAIENQEEPSNANGR